MSPPEPIVRDRMGAMDVVLGLVVTAFGVLPYLPGGGEPRHAGAQRDAGPRGDVPAQPAGAGDHHRDDRLPGSAGAAHRAHTSLVAVPILIYSIARWTTGAVGRITLLARHHRVGARSVALVARLRRSRRATASTAVAMIMACAGRCRRLLRARPPAARDAGELPHSATSPRPSGRLMLAEQQQRERSITVEERTRIARELHDIVAHSLSVIVVQAEGGRALAAKHPERAARGARHDRRDQPRGAGGDAADGRPAAQRRARARARGVRAHPGLADIPELVRKTSETAELSTFGPTPRVSQASGPHGVPDRPGIADQRAQARRSGAVARVTVAYTPESIEIEISDDGRGAAAPTDRLGHGLQGMRERVALHGGTLITRAALPGAVRRPGVAAVRARAQRPASRSISCGRPGAAR